MSDFKSGDATDPTYISDASRPNLVRKRRLPGSVGVLEALDKPMPIGVRHGSAGPTVAWPFEGVEVHGAELPSRYVTSVVVEEREGLSFLKLRSFPRRSQASESCHSDDRTQSATPYSTTSSRCAVTDCSNVSVDASR